MRETVRVGLWLKVGWICVWRVVIEIRGFEVNLDLWAGNKERLGLVVLGGIN